MNAYVRLRASLASCGLAHPPAAERLTSLASCGLAHPSAADRLTSLASWGLAHPSGAERLTRRTQSTSLYVNGSSSSSSDARCPNTD